MKLVTRRQLGWGSTRAGYAPCKNGMVAHYNGGPTGLSESAPHSRCISYWRNTRSFHVNGNGWIDIGYS